MQNVSERYREQMNKGVRNRGHIHVTLEVVNQKAQNNATVINGQNSLVYFSTPNANDLFHDDIEPEYYATDELNFTKVDGSMFFAPAQGSGATFRENGIVTDDFDTEIKITFIGGVSDLDIKGLTIDFGEFYPTELQIITDNDTKTYTNESSVFTTEDIFYGISYVRVIPLAMLDGSRRMRIVGFKFGLANEFYDSKVMDFSNNDYISPIGDSVPSRDMNLNIDNRDREYTPDNPESSVAFLEVGQKVKAQFGYDLDSNGNETEWLDPIVGYLSNWSASTSSASFTATDQYNTLSQSTYYRGKYNASGVTLYDLAIDVLADAGLNDTRDYQIDESLQNIIVYNPIPVVKHSEALQIIANMARCTLSVSRRGKVQIEKAYTPEVPDWSASSNSEMGDSNVAGIVHYGFESSERGAYYRSGATFIVKVTGFDLITPDGYTVSGSKLIASSVSGAVVSGHVFIVPNGRISGGETLRQWIPYMPTVTLTPEAPVSLYHMTLKFIGSYPKVIKLCSYDENDEQIIERTYNVNSLTYTITDSFLNLSKLEIQFIEGADNEKIVMSDIIIEDIWGFTVDSSSMKQSPTATRRNQLASVSAVRTLYQTSSEQKELNKGSVVVTPNNKVVTVYFSDASYGYSVSVATAGVSATITNSSNYFVEVTFSGISTETTVEYSISGYQYQLSHINEKKVYAKNGEDIVWSNPLVSTVAQARALAEWVGDFYNDDMQYDVSWRGDPRLDANDIIGMETVMGDIIMAKLSRNSLTYNGAWSGSFQARKVV